MTSPTALPYLDAVVRETLRTKAVLREIGRMVSNVDKTQFFLLTYTDVRTTGSSR